MSGSLAEALTDAVARLKEAVAKGSNDGASAAISRGLDCILQLDELYQTLTVDVSPFTVMKLAYHITGQHKSAPLGTVMDGLAQLRAAVQAYHYDFMCHQLVALCPMPTVHESRRIDDIQDPNAIRSVPAEHVSQLLQSKRLEVLRSQEYVADRFRVMLGKLANLWGVCCANQEFSLSENLTDSLQVRLTAQSILPISETVSPHDKIKANACEYLLNCLRKHDCHRVKNNSGKAEEVGVLGHVIHNGVATGCYREHPQWPTIGSFVAHFLTSSDAPEGVKQLSIISTPMFRDIHHYLAIVVDERFPVDNPNPVLVAFMNGRFNMKTMKFIPYGNSAEAQILRSTDLGAANEEELETLQGVARALHTKYNSMKDEEVDAFVASSKNMQPCHFIACDFDEDDTECTLQELRTRTECFETIFRAQNVPEEVMPWIYAMYGRILIPYEMCDDNWNITPFTIGAPGTGKSTVMDAVRKMLPAHEVRTVEKDGEKTFGMMSMKHARAIFGTETPNNISMGQLTKAMTHEGILVAEKGKEAKQLERFMAHFAFCGNEWFKQGDPAGQMVRRCGIIFFDYIVQEKDVTLMSKITAHMGTYMVLLLRCYHELAKQYGQCDFLNSAPRYFRDQAQRVFTESNALAAFICDQDRIKKTPENVAKSQRGPPLPGEFYVSWPAFTTAALDFARSRGIVHAMNEALSNSVNYLSVLALSRMRIFEGAASDYVNGAGMMHAKWVVGCTVKEVYDQMNNLFIANANN